MEIILYTILFLVLFLLVLLTSFFSFSETAIASLNKIKIISIIENSKNKKEIKKAKRVLKFSEHFNENITSIIIINNIINILASTLSTALFGAIFNASPLGYTISFLFMTILIVIFGELIPKMLAKKYSETGAMKFSFMIVFVNTILWPLTFLMSKMIKEKDKELFSNDDEIMYAINEAVDDGITSDDEKSIINRVLKFDSTKVSDFLVKKNDVLTIPYNSTKEEIRDFLVMNNHTRYPMIKDEKVISIFSSSKFLKDMITNSVTDLKKYQFTFKTFQLDESASLVFKVLKHRRDKLGIVYKNNKFYGIVTLEDISELILGEMYDEYDKKINGVYSLNETSYLIEPNVKIKYFINNFMNKKFNDPKYNNATIKEWALKKFNVKLINDEHFIFENLIFWIKNDKFKDNEIIFEVDII